MPLWYTSARGLTTRLPSRISYFCVFSGGSRSRSATVQGSPQLGGANGVVSTVMPPILAEPRRAAQFIHSVVFHRQNAVLTTVRSGGPDRDVAAGGVQGEPVRRGRVVRDPYVRPAARRGGRDVEA